MPLKKTAKYRYLILVVLSLCWKAPLADEGRYRALPEMIDSGRYLLEFKTAPLRNHSQRNRSPKKAELRAYRSDVIQKIRNILQTRVEIEHEFDTLIHAVSISAQPSQIEQLRNIPEIKQITKVTTLYLPVLPPAPKTNTVRGNDEKFYPPLDVKKIWEGHKLKGKGIRIAVLDTGVDYTHPDLGGCFGEGCKVAGGRDLVNNDADPMDDHQRSHGTHVAGIAAGNGRKLGVAPQAEIWAYKVCHQRGFCFSDDTIKALELAVDPNEDGDFSDSVHVINMSFGARGSEENPVELATEAVADFAIPVSSAGNSGALSLIGAPASARRAIAVGASDGESQLADFSNVGPSHDFRFKPNVVAPGVKIWSTAIGGKYSELGGTSMASPFVAGLAALIVESFKEKTNLTSRVAGVLAKTSRPIAFGGTLKEPGNYSPLQAYFFRGYGLVQPLASIEKPVEFVHLAENDILYPNSVQSDLGAHRVDYPVLQNFFRMTFQCIKKTEQPMAVTLESFLGEGAELEALPTSFTCQSPGQKVSIKFRLRQRTESLPASTHYPDPFGFLLKIGQGGKSHEFVRPIAGFIRARYSLTLLKKERLFNNIQLLDERTGRRIKLPLDYEADNSEIIKAEAFLTPGDYTEVFRGQTTFLLRPELRMWIQSKVRVERETKRHITRKALNYRTTFEFKDSNGKIQNGAHLGLEFFSPVHKSGWSRGFTMGTTTRATLLSNQIDKDFRKKAFVSWKHPNKVDLHTELLTFDNPDNKIHLPSKGYFSLSLAPRLRGVPSPKSICYRTWLDAEIETLAETVQVGIGNAGITRIKTILAPVFQKLSACFFDPASIDANFAFFPNGRPAIGTLLEGKPFLELPQPVEMGNSTPFLTGAGYIRLNNRSFQFSVNETSGRYGEDWKSENVRYQVIDTEKGETLKEGSGVMSGSIKPIPLGTYRYLRTLDYGHGNVSSDITFSVPDSKENFKHYLPALNKFVWKERENRSVDLYLEYREYLESHKASPGSKIDQITLFIRPASATEWQQLELKYLEGFSNVLKASLALPSDKELTDYKVKIELTNASGDTQVVTSTKPFVVYDPESSN